MTSRPRRLTGPFPRTGARAGPARRLCVLVAGEHTFATHPLPGRGELVIGRAESCDLCVEDGAVSRVHAVLRVAGTLTIEDRHSSNGTCVNGRPLAPGQPLAIEPGATIEIGATVLVIQYRAIDEVPPGAWGKARAEGAADAVTPVDPVMMRLYQLVPRIAASEINVLILGETGVGKEVLAEHIHRRSPRATGPLLRLNCAALSETLLESELFGHERGAFTGAAHAKPGLLETATGGTVFLDEVGDLSPKLQAKLLRLLEERRVLRVGGLVARPIDVRFIAATHHDLEADTGEGRFRSDLFFRLDGVTLHVPPLRARHADIEPLARAFVAGACRRAGARVPPELTPDALRALRDYAWPGNVRELRNTIERALLLCTGPALGPEHLGAITTRPAPTGPVMARPRDVVGFSRRRDAYERELIVAALERANGNQTVAARELGLPRRTLVRRLESFGLPRPRKR